jgi:hypothetical protein
MHMPARQFFVIVNTLFFANKSEATDISMAIKQLITTLCGVSKELSIGVRGGAHKCARDQC